MAKDAFTDSFSQPCQAMKSHNRACKATGRTLTMVCGCFCKLLNKQLRYLCLLAAVTHTSTHPTHHLPPLSPTHPLTHDIHDIIGSVQKPRRAGGFSNHETQTVVDRSGMVFANPVTNDETNPSLITNELKSNVQRPVVNAQVLLYLKHSVWFQ